MRALHKRPQSTLYRTCCCVYQKLFDSSCTYSGMCRVSDNCAKNENRCCHTLRQTIMELQGVAQEQLRSLQEKVSLARVVRGLKIDTDHHYRPRFLA